MKIPRASKNENDPSIKGNLSAEEIVRTDWKRNYEKKGIPLASLKQSIKDHVDDGGQMGRMRNTLIFLKINEGEDDVLFHTFTADVYEVYMSMMQLFSLSLAKTRGIETLYTFVSDKSAYRMASKLYGKENVDIEEEDNQENGKYKLTIDIGEAYRQGQRAVEAKARG
jgi:hypothetical protein